MIRTAASLAISIALAIGAATAPANAAAYPTGFQEEPIVEGLTRPTQAIWAPDGRMFVAEQDGVLKAVNPDGSTKVVLSIPNRVNSAGDRGLLGIAADSQIATNGYLYLAYTAETLPLTPDGNGAMTAQISRIQIDADSDLVGETIILGTRSPSLGACPAPPSNTVDCLPSDADTHTIGSIHSMADGTLFLGLGDGGDFNTVNDNVRRAQNEQSPSGKIMHIDRNGLGLSGHAFCPGDAVLTHVCTKLHAKGFRNPFRFKPNGTGGFNLGDVGQGSREEIDVVTSAGKNYGWPCYEANLQYDGYESDQLCQDLYAAEGTPQGATPPDYEYFHDDVGGDAASLGGPTYQAAEYPAAYQGRIFFGDYAAGFMKVLEPTGPGGALVAQPFATDWFGVDLVSAPNGDIAYASFGTGANGTGSIQRIVYSPNNAQPVADAQATPQSSANAPETVDFDGSGSTDADGDDLTYEWDFDNGGSTADSTEEQPSFTFTQAGTYDVKLTVDDGRGKSDTDTVRVDIGNTPPVPNITGPTEYTSGDTVTLQASATDAQDPAITDFSWRAALKHGEHEHGGQNDVPGATYELDTPTTHGADSYYEVTVTATDSGGLQGTKTVRLDPQTTTLRIESTPGGGDVTLNYYRNEPFLTPYQAFEAIGFETTVLARESFVSGGRTYTFERWSDGPTTRSRNVTVPGTPLTLVAQYNGPPVANATATPQSSPNAPETVDFDASGSTDADGDDLTYEWDFDNGGSTADSTEEQPSFTFTQAGTYDVKLTVDDGRGQTATDNVRVDIGNTPPVPSIDDPPTLYTNGDTVTLEGSASDDLDSDAGIDLSWRSVLVHRGNEQVVQDNVPGPTLQLPTDDSHGADSHYKATLTATDSGGLTDETTARLDPRTKTLRIESLPAGGHVTLTYYSNSPFVTPYVAPEAINFQTAIVAEESFSASGRSYRFERWSDGPTTRSRNVTVPGTPLTLVARYADVTPPPAKPPSKPKPAPDRTGPTFGFNTKTALHTRRSRLRGVVADPSGLKRMRVAVGRKSRDGLCAWWSTKRKRLSAPTRRCDKPVWIAAKLKRRSKGTYEWGIRLRRRLPRGAYRIALLAEDPLGNAARRLGNGPRLRAR